MSYPYITSKAQLRLILATSADVSEESINQLQSWFDTAEFELVRPWLGQATLDEIHNPSPAQAAAVAEVVKLLAIVVATYGYRLYAAQGQLVLGMNGPRRPSTADQKPLSPAELASLVQELEGRALGALDQVLVYLEQHPQQFATWHSSPECTLFAGHFFRTADEFNRYAQGTITRAVFRKAWPLMRTAELSVIRHVLGRPLIARLLAELDQPAHAEVIDLVRTGITGQVMLSDDCAHEAGIAALDELKFLLNLPDNLVKYPEFEESPLFVPPYVPADQSNAFYNGF